MRLAFVLISSAESAVKRTQTRLWRKTQIPGAVTTTLVQDGGAVRYCGDLGTCIAHYAHIVTMLTACIAHQSRKHLHRLQISGASEAVAARPQVTHTIRVHFEGAFFSSVIFADERALKHMHSGSDATFISTEHDVYNVLQEAEDLCSNGELKLHFTDEIPMQSTGLVFRKHSNYTEAFSVVVAERLDEYIRTLREQMGLAKQCERLFYPDPKAAVYRFWSIITFPFNLTAGQMRTD